MSDEDDRPGGVGAFFSTFANAMLERSLPAIREWLQGRLGARARIGQVEIEGTHLLVRDATIPVGARLVIHVDRARLLTDPEAFVSGLPPVRLETLTGRLRAMDGGVDVFDAAIRIECPPGALGGDWVDGALRLEDGRWSQSRGVGEPAPLEGTARLCIGQRGWSVADGELLSGDSRITVEGKGAVGSGERLERLAMTFAHARAGHLLDAMEAFLGRPLSGLPAGLAAATIDGGLGRERGRTRADVTLCTPARTAGGVGSELRVALDLDGDVAVKAEVVGTAHLDELWPAAWPAIADAERSRPLTIDARGAGPLRTLTGEAQISSEALALRLLHEAPRLDAQLRVSERSAQLRLALGGAASVELESAIGEGGALDGEGSLRLRPDALTLFGHRLDGPPIVAPLRIEGTRAAPRLALHGKTPALSLGDLALRRARLNAQLGGGSSAELSARVGPGEVRVRHRPGRTALRASRIESKAAVAIAGLVFERQWVGQGDEARLRWPADAQLWVDLVREAPRLEGTIHVETPRSRASLAPLVFDGAAGFDGTRVRGILDTEEAAEIGLLGASVRLSEGSRVLVDAKVRGPRAAPVFDAQLSSPAVGVSLGALGALPLEQAEAQLVVTRDAIELVSLDAELFGGVARVRHARLAFGGSLAVSELLLAGLSRGLGAHLTKDPRALSSLALDAQLSGRGGRLEGRAHLRTQRSSLTADVVLLGGVPSHGTSLEGHIDGADVSAWLGPFGFGGAPLRVDARVLGAPGEPQLHVSAHGEDVIALVADAAIPVRRAQVRARLGRHLGLVWDGLKLELLGGTVRSHGARAPGFLVAEVAAQGLRIGDIELAEGPLSRRLSGTLGGVLRLFGRRSVGVRMRALLEQPRYGALRELAPFLERYGLPVPRLEGDGPVTALVSGRLGDALFLEELVARLPELHASARARLNADGSLAGRVMTHVSGAWLARSTRFATAAKLLGDVELPLSLGGRIDAPQLSLELAEALDLRLADTALGAALETLFGRATRSAPTHLPPPNPELSLLDVDTLLERAASVEDHADDALGALLERGLSPADILERIAKTRSDT